jgi:hypothetical protein
MAMQRVTPVPVRVRRSWPDGRPVEIGWGPERIPVRSLRAVRWERSAYPVDLGPRTVFEVDTPLAKLSLTYLHRSGRWQVEGIDPDG